MPTNQPTNANCLNGLYQLLRSKKKEILMEFLIQFLIFDFLADSEGLKPKTTFIVNLKLFLFLYVLMEKQRKYFLGYFFVQNDTF